MMLAVVDGLRRRSSVRALVAVSSDRLLMSRATLSIGAHLDTRAKHDRNEFARVR